MWNLIFEVENPKSETQSSASLSEKINDGAKCSIAMLTRKVHEKIFSIRGN